jgi:hypothetical protein
MASANYTAALPPLSPLSILATGLTVLATVLITTSKYSPVARPTQTLFSRIYLSLVLFTKNLWYQSNKGTAIDDETVITSLYKYPVKSLRTIPCNEVVLDGKGIVGDRRYMLVVPAPRPIYGDFLPNDPTHRFVTQRQCPILARVVVVDVPVGGKHQLQFSCDALPNETCIVSMEPETNAPIYKSTLWGDIVTVQDMGDTIAAYMQKIIALDETAPEEGNKNIRLTMQYVHDTRTANDKFVPPVARSIWGKNPTVHLGDGFPLYVFFNHCLRCNFYTISLISCSLIFLNISQRTC